MMSFISRYVIVRTEKAGCFAGYLKSKDGNEVVLTQSRRLWYWDGAASLSELAEKGSSKPQNCKFPAPVPEHLMLGVIEIIPVSELGEASIKEVKVWSAH